MDIAAAKGEEILDYCRSMGIPPYDVRKGVYKYRTIARAREILESNTIYFASPVELDDVFELHPSLLDLTVSDGVRRRFLARILGDACPPFFDIDKHAFQKHLEDDVRKLRNNVGIFSTARTATNGLLWEQYADKKKGVCFCFRSDNFINKLALGVNYTDAPKKVNFIDPKFATLSKDFLYWFCTKHKDYISEDEVRIIDESRCGSLAFPKSWLSEIIFGLNTSKEDQEGIIDLVARHKYPVEKIGRVTDSAWGFKIEYF